MLSTNLKENTKEAHQSLEKTVVSRLKSIRSEADYAGVLQYFYVYFNKLEQHVSKYVSQANFPAMEDRRTSAYLKADIEELGYSTEHLPEVTIPEISDKLQALGALYVMEGSIMGGPYIIQMLARLGIDRGISFYSGYGENTSQRWQNFIQGLEANASTPDEHQRVIDTANQTFEHFMKVFSSPKV